MMQIYIYAIENSRKGKPEYVLSRSLDTFRTNDEKQVVEYLKHGFEIKGKFVNGVGEYKYRVSDSPFVTAVTQFVGNILGCEVVKNADSIVLDFQEFFTPVSCDTEELKLSISFWNQGETKPEIVRVNNDRAEKIRNFLLFNCFINQDKEYMLDVLEKKIAKDNQSKCQMLKVDFTGGYYEWLLYVGGNLVYVFGDEISESITENTTHDDLMCDVEMCVECMIEELQEKESEYISLVSENKKNIVSKILEVWANHFGIEA